MGKTLTIGSRFYSLEWTRRQDPTIFSRFRFGMGMTLSIMPDKKPRHSLPARAEELQELLCSHGDGRALVVLLFHRLPLFLTTATSAKCANYASLCPGIPEISNRFITYTTLQPSSSCSNSRRRKSRSSASGLIAILIFIFIFIISWVQKVDK